MTGILSDIRILELAATPAGAFCAKLLADQGADVVKVEPPTGDPARREPPFLAGASGERQGSQFLAFNTNKRGVALDASLDEGREALLRLVASRDVLVEDFAPGRLDELGLGYETLRALNPGLIVVSITPFGQAGPYSAYKGGDLVAQAVGGFLYTTGESDRPPMGTALEQTHVAAARNAAIATMGAILQREFTGEGQHIDVSIMEAVVSTPPAFIHQYSYTGAIAGRGFGEGNVMDGMHLPTADSDVTLTTAGTGGNPMRAWAAFLDEPRLLDNRFATPSGRAEHASELLALVQSKLRHRKAHEFMTDAMDRRLVVGVVQSPEEVAGCPHLAERGTFVGIDHAHAGALRYPGPGFMIDGSNPMTGGRPAPRLGEHNAEVLGGELGLTEQQISRLA